ncbi:glycoside hydrolase family 104 protein [Pantoea sp. LMR881]|uniref:glycoside hydrolase family 24 protein n=1 Tax=Pantoea sp. LMR881 TaxID=3014336 RepID=UPI0022AE8BE9|nr:glycoside hydrolase family 104 protein [Pantoea sp. LMR881]MCZ4061225.1 glycoside hydrolase family 104 protein [Pantoea sp. LMR881]
MTDISKANRKAALDVIAFCEGTSTSPFTRNNGYDVIVTGLGEKGEVFTDYRDHPFANGRPSKVWSKSGATSNAAGRYQQMYRWWPAYKKQLGLPDFSPASQDRLALQIIREQKALTDVDRGDMKAFAEKCCDIWASLPGSPHGQPTKSLAVIQQKFLEFGGIVA